MKIALTAPTGKVGTAVLAAAKGADVTIAALGRSVDRLAGDRVETRHFDFADRSTYAGAFDGADALILIAPSNPQQVEQESAAVDAALDAGVAHIVKLSAIGADFSDSSFLRLHRGSQEHIAARNAPATILQPTFFMQNSLGLGGAIKSGVYPAAMEQARMSQIDAADIGAVAVAVAQNREHHLGKTYVLTEGRTYSGDDFAHTFSSATGHPVNYVGLSEDAFRSALLGSGLDAWYAQGLVELYQFVRAGHADTTTGHVQEILGRAPRSLAEFARENAAAFS